VFVGSLGVSVELGLYVVAFGEVLVKIFLAIVFSLASIKGQPNLYLDFLDADVLMRVLELVPDPCGETRE
jgi:hypothetical protein